MKTISAHISMSAAVLIMVSVTPAQATIIGSSADNGNGTFTYSYKIDNTVGAFDSIGFSLDFSFSSLQIDWNQNDTFSGGSVKVPDFNWLAQAGIPVTGQSAQDFLSLDPASDVLVGASLSGFSFISTLTPGNVSYYEFGAAGESSSGTTFGPSFAGVPDVGSSISYLAGAIVFLRLGRKVAPRFNQF